jgi:sirohydrochlorin ferrochelatase
MTGATDEGVMRIARAIRARKIVSEVAVGLVRGSPTIEDALCRLAAHRVIVYPLFASNGYFTRDRLVKLIDEANAQKRAVEILAPLGLDPGLSDLVLGRVSQVAHESGFADEVCTVVLLAHGSRRNPASRTATEQVAREIIRRRIVREVRTAFLEEAPSLEDTVSAVDGPVIVMGMFSGEGLHGARDAPRLIAQVGRVDIVYAGVIGNAPGIAHLISCALQAALERTGK